jgi:hypothetical protein
LPEVPICITFWCVVEIDEQPGVKGGTPFGELNLASNNHSNKYHDQE